MEVTFIFCIDSFFSSHVLMYLYSAILSFSGVMKGREDDNIETIRKRFNVFLESSLPVVEYYDSKGKVRKVICLRNCLYIAMHIA
jgi:adenylate kinase family enzyme